MRRSDASLFLSLFLHDVCVYVCVCATWHEHDLRLVFRSALLYLFTSFLSLARWFVIYLYPGIPTFYSIQFFFFVSLQFFDAVRFISYPPFSSPSFAFAFRDEFITFWFFFTFFLVCLVYLCLCLCTCRVAVAVSTRTSLPAASAPGALPRCGACETP
jgi:hypothetical protein